jgi:hypothetical protein
MMDPTVRSHDDTCQQLSTKSKEGIEFYPDPTIPNQTSLPNQPTQTSPSQYYTTLHYHFSLLPPIHPTHNPAAKARKRTSERKKKENKNKSVVIGKAHRKKEKKKGKKFFAL